MNSSQLNLSELRQTINKAQSPYRVVNREQIQFVGKIGDDMDTKTDLDGYGQNVYKIDGMEVLATNYVSDALDKIIGLAPKQRGTVKAASGDAGVRDFRNYLATANSIVKPTKVALVANPDSRTVTDVIPLKDTVISSDAFFDFAEMFMERAGLYPVSHQTAFNPTSGFTLFMDSESPLVKQFAPNEDFLLNSYYLKWNLGQIELGRYYERLICSNGQTETVKEKEARIHSLETGAIQSILSIPQNRDMLDAAYTRFSTKALLAMETRASLAELGKVHKLLTEHMVESKVVADVAPYEREVQKYAAIGYDMQKYPQTQMKASMSFWELYNSVTAFATHTEIWSENDNRRSTLQGEAVSLLMKDRDIKTYFDAFPSAR